MSFFPVDFILILYHALLVSYGLKLIKLDPFNQLNQLLNQINFISRAYKTAKRKFTANDLYEVLINTVALEVSLSKLSTSIYCEYKILPLYTLITRSFIVHFISL